MPTTEAPSTESPTSVSPTSTSPTTEAPTTSTPTIICFHGDTQVELESGELVAMNKLKLGSRVAVVDALGAKAFSTVYSFRTAFANNTSEQMKISFGHAGGFIKLSKPHLLVVSDSALEPPRYESAVNVKPGMFLWRVTDAGSLPVQVTGASRETMQGVYAPMTHEGTIVANGIAASVYAIYDHGKAHALFGLLRLWRSFVPHARVGMTPLENTIEPFAYLVTKAFKGTWVGNTFMAAVGCHECWKM